MVLAIVAVLGTLAVGGYVQYRKSVLLDLTADEIVSRFYELKSKSQYGYVDGKRFEQIVDELGGGAVEAVEIKPVKCHGIYFSPVAGGFEIKTFVQNFSGEKYYEKAVDAWIYRGCGGFFASEIHFEDMEMDEAVKVRSVYDSGGVSGAFYLRFMPPDGRLEQFGGSNKLFAELDYDRVDGEKNNSQKRIIEFDLTNGNATIQKKS